MKISLNAAHTRRNFIIPLILCIFILTSTMLVSFYRHVYNHAKNDMHRQNEQIGTYFKRELSARCARHLKFVELLRRDSSMERLLGLQDGERAAAYAENLLNGYSIEMADYDVVMHRVECVPCLEPLFFALTVDTSCATMEGYRCGLSITEDGVLLNHMFYPMFKEGALVGYVEIVEDIRPLFTKLEAIFDANVAFVVTEQYIRDHFSKKTLAPTRLEAETSEQYFYVIDPFDETFSPDFARLLYRPYKKEMLQKLTLLADGKRVEGSFISLAGSGEIVQGGLLVVKDLSANLTQFNNLLAYFISAAIMAGLFFFAFFRYFVRSVERRLRDLHRQLGQKVEELTRTEKLLKEKEKDLIAEIEYRKKSEVLLEEQVAELERTRAAMLNIMEDAERESEDRKHAQLALKTSNRQLHTV